MTAAPRDGTRVLLAFQHGSLSAAAGKFAADHGDWFVPGVGVIRNNPPVAWMPLPPLPPLPEVTR